MTEFVSAFMRRTDKSRFWIPGSAFFAFRCAYGLRLLTDCAALTRKACLAMGGAAPELLVSIVIYLSCLSMTGSEQATVPELGLLPVVILVPVRFPFIA